MIIFIDVHVLIDQMEKIITVRAGGVAKVENGNIVAIAVLGDSGVVAKKVAFGICAEEAHPAGTGIFDVGI